MSPSISGRLRIQTLLAVLLVVSYQRESAAQARCDAVCTPTTPCDRVCRCDFDPSTCGECGGSCAMRCVDMGGTCSPGGGPCPGGTTDLGPASDCQHCCYDPGPSCGAIGGDYCSQSGSCPPGYQFLGFTYDCHPCCHSPPPPPNCNCYWSTDCASPQYCSYGGCGLAPKGTPGYCPYNPGSGQCDGTCAGAGAAWDVPLDRIVQAVDLVFQAYEETVKTGKSGYPSPTFMARAQAIELSSGLQEEILRKIYNVLDVTLGYDFTFPQSMNASGQAKFGFIRFVPEGRGTLVLLKGVHQGVLDAIKQGNPSAVVPPLEAFFAEFPNYRPAHVGRCYPHGHEYPDNALQCLTDELTRMLSVWLTNRPSDTGAPVKPKVRGNKAK